MKNSNHPLIDKVSASLGEIFAEGGLSGKTVIVALSGGADSVSLLFSLHTLREALCFRVCACHVNHGIRGEEGDRDEAFSASLCRRLGIPFRCGHFDVPALAKERRTGIEETARSVRYEYFEDLLRNGFGDFIATAHNACDNAETVLMYAVRGSGTAGLTGIPKRRDRVIRPLLSVTRTEIEEYLSAIGESYVTDSTNLADDCTRNILRHSVLPTLRKINPALEEALLRLGRIAEADNEYLNTAAKEADTDSIREAAKLADAILSRVIAEKVRAVTGYAPDFLHTQELCRAIKAYAVSGSGEKKLYALPGKAEVCLYGDAFRVYRKEERQEIPKPAKGYAIPLKAGLTVLPGGKWAVLTAAPDADLPVTFTADDAHCAGNFPEIRKTSPDFRKNIYSLFITAGLFSDIIGKDVFLRPRKSGDRIRLGGMSKSIKKLLCDKKVPIEERDELPLLLIGERVLALPYIGVCDREDAETVPKYTVGFYKLG